MREISETRRDAFKEQLAEVQIHTGFELFETPFADLSWTNRLIVEATISVLIPLFRGRRYSVVMDNAHTPRASFVVTSGEACGYRVTISTDSVTVTSTVEIYDVRYNHARLIEALTREYSANAPVPRQSEIAVALRQRYETRLN